MGRDADHGVIDHQHRVFGYKGLYVMDGSAVSANPGVNPSLTITALAEGFAAAHKRLYGFVAEGEAVQLVTYRVEAVGLEGDEGVGVLREAAGHRGGEAGVLRLGAQDGFGELEVEGGGVAGEV